MTPADRLNHIITAQKDHQDRVCPPARHNKNYIYILTDNSRPEKKETLTFSRTLAMLIALEFG